MTNDALLCEILGRLATLTHLIEDQAHELRALRQLIEEKASATPKPRVVRNPWYAEPHDLGMRKARNGTTYQDDGEAV